MSFIISKQFKEYSPAVGWQVEYSPAVGWQVDIYQPSSRLAGRYYSPAVGWQVDIYQPPMPMLIYRFILSLHSTGCLNNMGLDLR